MEILRTTTDNEDFRSLVSQLDAYLTKVDGDESLFYSQFNKIEFLDQVVLVYWEEEAVGCGALKPVFSDQMEIKRMFVLPQYRGRGVASAVVAALESWARELGASSCVLETGQRQTEAVSLYKKLGFQQIPNYEPYVGVENSICFEKLL